MEGRFEIALAIWEVVRPYALASCAGALIGLLFLSLAWG